MKKIINLLLILPAICSILLWSGCQDDDPNKNRTTIIFKGPEKMTMSYRNKVFDGLRRRMPPGEFVFKFSAPGYYPLWKKYTINPGQADMVETISLQPFHSALYITAQAAGIKGDARARIFRDGIPCGTTPQLLTGLRMGRHMIKLTLPGFADYAREIVVNSPRPLPQLKAVLVSTNGYLTVKGTPEGAFLSIDGKQVGTLPWSGNLNTGRVSLGVSAEGYLAQTRETIIKAGEKNVVSINLEPQKSSLSVRSKPSNATLLLNGKKLGTTPFTINNLTPGNYNVEIIHDDFEPYKRTVEVKAGSNDEIFAALRSGYGSVRLNIRPSGVDLFVDGQPVGRTVKDPARPGETLPITVKNLVPGKHICTMSHPRSNPAKKEFEFTVKREEIIVLPVRELWVADCIVQFNDGEIIQVKKEYETPTHLNFSPRPGISTAIENAKIKKITMIDTDEK